MAYFTPPDHEQADITDDAKKLLDVQAAQANKSNDQIVNDTMHGVHDSTQMMNNQDNQTKTLGMSMPDDHLAALHERAQRAYDSSEIGLRNQAKLHSANRAMGINSQATNSIMMKQNLDNKWYQNELQMRDAKVQSRNAMISVLFSGLGQAAGSYAGSQGARNQTPTPASNAPNSYQGPVNQNPGSTYNYYSGNITPNTMQPMQQEQSYDRGGGPVNRDMITGGRVNG